MIRQKSEIYHYLGLVYYNYGKYDKAERYLKKARNLNPRLKDRVDRVLRSISYN